MVEEGRRPHVTVIIGTSGWQYRDWRGLFYPTKLPQRLWLEHYAQFFATVESNNAFYRLPERETFVKWRERTPPDFPWGGQASRLLTPTQRVRGPPGARPPPEGGGRGPGPPPRPHPAAAPAHAKGRPSPAPGVPRRVPRRHAGGRRTSARELVDRRDP